MKFTSSLFSDIKDAFAYYSVLNNRINVNHLFADGSTAILKTDSLPSIKRLIKFGADLNAKNSGGFTALMMSKNPDLTRLLLESGADVNASTKDGVTAIMLADSPEISKILFDAGANVGNKTDNQEIKYQLNVCLIEACKNNDINMVKRLLSNGADVNAEANNTLPLLEASTYDIAKLLIDAGANVNADRTLTVLCDAIGIKKRSINIIELLIDSGADVNLTCKYIGYTPLFVITNLEQAKLLVSRGADLTYKFIGELPHEQKRIPEVEDGEAINAYLKNCYDSLNEAVAA